MTHRLPGRSSPAIAPPMSSATAVRELDLTAENQTEKLVVFTVSAGTEHAERLALLSVIGTETFTPAETVEADAAT